MTYAKLYDRLVQFYPGEYDFYLQFALGKFANGARVLITPCATGWLALALARQGFQATGVDLEPEMVAIAQDKLARLPKREKYNADFTVGNMLNFGERQEFDFVIIPQRGILCLSAKDLAKAFAHFAEILRPGGFLVFDFSENQTAPLFRYCNRFSGLRVVEEVESVENGVNQLLTVQSEKSEFPPYQLKLELHYPQTEEIRRLLCQSEFLILNRYGDFFGNPYQPVCGYQIWICKKA